MASLEVTWLVLQLVLWHQKVKRREGKAMSWWVLGKETEILSGKA